MKKVLIAGALGVLFLCPLTVTEGHAALKWEKIPDAEEAAQFSDYDEKLLIRIAAAEAENQHCEGMFKVMEVVLNRVESPKYPNSIEGVIFQDNAFSSVKNGRFDEVQIPRQAFEALARIESGEERDHEIVGFEVNNGKDALLKYYDYKYTVGCHNFYVEKGGEND